MKSGEITRLRLMESLSREVTLQSLMGLQSQFLRNAEWAARMRGISLDRQGNSCFRAWTLRGTMHVHDVADYALYLHEGNRSPYLRDYWDDTAAMSMARKERAADKMLSLLAEGVTARREVIERFRADGASQTELDYLFNPWGGLPRVLMEQRQIVQTVSEELRYRLAPQAAPIPAEQAMWEQMRRYLMGYAPCSVEDAAYFFRYGKRVCKALMDSCAAASAGLLVWRDGLVYRTDREPAGGEDVYVLSGFDPLLVGYEKKTNPMVPPAALRTVYTLQGIIKPVVVVEGRCIATWGVRMGRVWLCPFGTDSAAALDRAEELLRQLTGCGEITYE